MKRIRRLSNVVVVMVVLMINGALRAGDAPERPRIEVVFVLDTTGSMSGLIEAAKQKIWAIANTMASAKPVPRIEMGLVGYRDRGDAYVTKRTELAADLDAVYADLLAYQALGGGDSPESVNQALHEAVALTRWSDDRDTYRVAFLVGDCPPHMDYQDDKKYPTTCALAAEEGITINTIQCGHYGHTESIWRDIADRAGGRYFRVEQSRGVTVTATPFDGELAKLSGELEETMLYYGSRDAQAANRRRRELADTIRKSAKITAQAQRALFNASAAGEANLLGNQELVHDIAEGRVVLSEIKEEDLPEMLQNVSPEHRERLVKQRGDRRLHIQEQMAAIGARREAYIQEQMTDARMNTGESFDAAVLESVKEQAGKKGIRLTSTESH